MRVSKTGHEESKPLQSSCAGIKRWTTRMAFPQRGQCQRWQSGRGGRGRGSWPWAARSVRARGNICLRKRLASSP